MADQALTPETIADQPIPLIDSSTSNQSTIVGSKTISTIESQNGLQPTTYPDRPITQNPIASDVIGTSLDTQQRRILGAYQFGQMGAIEIGKFVKGQSGDLRITPDGMIARNKNGLPFFALSEAGISLTDGNDQTIVDARGIRSTSQFNPSILHNNLDFQTSNASFDDVPGSSFYITADRDVNIYFSLEVYVQSANAGFLNGSYVEVQLFDDFLNGSAMNIFGFGAISTRITANGDGTISWVYSWSTTSNFIANILTVQKGRHNYKLQMRAVSGGTAEISSFTINMLTLGT